MARCRKTPFTLPLTPPTPRVSNPLGAATWKPSKGGKDARQLRAANYATFRDLEPPLNTPLLHPRRPPPYKSQPWPTVPRPYLEVDNSKPPRWIHEEPTAVITGATDGIGRAYAEAPSHLAQQLMFLRAMKRPGPV
uniref:Uncharacterized protein n=1 Tax=Timema bartmani TaxID=61472 RepID=A0A7R9EQD7_9NEOP|nr:unnamed protein product [Timema bartmani]